MKFPKHSYSQMGEDLIIDNYWRWYKKDYSEMYYLDIGVCNPIGSNNTYLFYTNGASGMLIEPDPDQYSKIKKIRPRDTIMQVGASGKSQKDANFFVMTAKSLSSFSKDTADKLSNEIKAYGKQKIEKIHKVDLLSITDIQRRCKKCPDLVSIDTEGFDLEIIEAWDFDYSLPDIFCVETDGGGKSNSSKIADILLARKYRKFAFTNLNTIFTRR